LSNIAQFQVTSAKLTTGGSWTNAADKKLKENFEDLDGNDVLDKISKLPITRWDYIKEGSATKHIGPMAQDFNKLFGVGDDTTISTIDPAGVALKGIQALIVSSDQKDEEIAQQQQQINDLKNAITEMQTAMSQCCASYQSSSKSSAQDITGSVENARLEQKVVAQ
jgi:Chaperone of endosialidase